jgi:hypothetical protein
MRQRTQVINALRAHMAELGIVAAQEREGTVPGARYDQLASAFLLPAGTRLVAC